VRTCSRSAAAINLGDQLNGKKVVGILSGGNFSMERLAAIIKDRRQGEPEKGKGRSDE
jgi:threonine dehydratase